MAVTIYHNPRCSKSRQTLELLNERDLDLQVIEYLKTPPSAAELDEILNPLEMEPRDLMRTSEAAYAQAGLGDENLNREALIEAMVANPILIQRPVVLANGKAAIGRPPESALEIL